MKLNDYVFKSDIEKLSKDQYESFTCYLKFVGVDNWITYDNICTGYGFVDILIVCLKSNSRAALLWSKLDTEPYAANPIPYEEILNMAELGELMTYENR